MKVLCNKTTKKIEGFVRNDSTELEFNPDTHVVLNVSKVPDMELDRLNNTGTSIRASTQAERDADDVAEKDAQALEAASSPALEAAIEEFSAILTTAGIGIPADVKANIADRIKGKLP